MYESAKGAYIQMRHKSATAVLVLTLGLALPSVAETLAVSELARRTHIHSLAVDRQDPSYLLIATHHGLFRASSDGTAQRISEDRKSTRLNSSHIQKSRMPSSA